MIGGSGPKAFQPQVDDIILGPLEGDVSQEHSLDEKPCHPQVKDPLLSLSEGNA